MGRSYGRPTPGEDILLQAGPDGRATPAAHMAVPAAKADFVMAAADVLDVGVSCDDHSR